MTPLDITIERSPTLHRLAIIGWAGAAMALGVSLTSHVGLIGWSALALSTAAIGMAALC